MSAKGKPSGMCTRHKSRALSACRGQHSSSPLTAVRVAACRPLCCLSAITFVRVVGNASVHGSESDVASLVEAGVLSPLCALLAYPDESIVLVVLDALKCILRVGKGGGRTALAATENPSASVAIAVAASPANAYTVEVEEWGGLDRLAELQQHENQQINQKATELIQNYFCDEEGSEAEEIEPPQGGEGQMHD